MVNMFLNRSSAAATARNSSAVTFRIDRGRTHVDGDLLVGVIPHNAVGDGTADVGCEGDVPSVVGFSRFQRLDHKSVIPIIVVCVERVLGLLPSLGLQIHIDGTRITAAGRGVINTERRVASRVRRVLDAHVTGVEAGILGRKDDIVVGTEARYIDRSGRGIRLHRSGHAECIGNQVDRSGPCRRSCYRRRS